MNTYKTISSHVIVRTLLMWNILATGDRWGKILLEACVPSLEQRSTNISENRKGCVYVGKFSNCRARQLND